MAANVHDIGDKVRLGARVYDIDGNLVDPSTFVLYYKKPQTGEIVTVSSPTNPEVGVYYTDVEPDEYGNWFWKVVGTGSNQIVEESRFIVREPQISS